MLYTKDSFCKFHSTCRLEVEWKFRLAEKEIGSSILFGHERTNVWPDPTNFSSTQQEKFSQFVQSAKKFVRPHPNKDLVRSQLFSSLGVAANAPTNFPHRIFLFRYRWYPTTSRDLPENTRGWEHRVLRGVRRPDAPFREVADRGIRAYMWDRGEGLIGEAFRVVWFRLTFLSDPSDSSLRYS